MTALHFRARLVGARFCHLLAQFPRSFKFHFPSHRLSSGAGCERNECTAFTRRPASPNTPSCTHLSGHSLKKSHATVGCVLWTCTHTHTHQRDARYFIQQCVCMCVCVWNMLSFRSGIVPVVALLFVSCCDQFDSD